MREEFNELLDERTNYSLLIYGYGFNDDHVDTAIVDSFLFYQEMLKKI